MKVKNESEVAQSCPTLLDPMDCSLPGSSVHGIFQARVLEWGCHCLLDLDKEESLCKRRLSRSCHDLLVSMDARLSDCTIVINAKRHVLRLAEQLAQQSQPLWICVASYWLGF